MDDGTYLEEFIQTVELLPNDIRRDFELMRVLDKDCIEMRAEVTKSEVNCKVYMTNYIKTLSIYKLYCHVVIIYVYNFI